MPLVGEVRRDVGGIVGVVVAGWCSIFVHFLNSVGRSVLSGESGVDVGAEGLLESVHAGVACLWVAVVSLVVGTSPFLFPDSDALARDGQGCRRRCGEVAMMGLRR